MDKDLIIHFQHIKSLITQGRSKALQAANTYALITYWNVGAYLSQKLSSNTYGKKVADELAKWLLTQEPTLKGFDRRNLYRMKDFFESWSTTDWSLIAPNIANDKIVIGDMTRDAIQKIVGFENPQLPNMPTILTKVTWTHHIEILKRTATPEEKLFYLVLSIKDRYTTTELVRQIKSALFER